MMPRLVCVTSVFLFCLEEGVGRMGEKIELPNSALVLGSGIWQFLLVEVDLDL